MTNPGTPPDYYELLEVDRGATPKQIKRAYRKLARELHPDVNPDGDARKQFQKATSAYNVLSDPETRKYYDESGIDPYATDPSAQNPQRGLSAIEKWVKRVEKFIAGWYAEKTPLAEDWREQAVAEISAWQQECNGSIRSWRSDQQGGIATWETGTEDTIGQQAKIDHLATDHRARVVEVSTGQAKEVEDTVKDQTSRTNNAAAAEKEELDRERNRQIANVQEMAEEQRRTLRGQPAVALEDLAAQRATIEVGLELLLEGTGRQPPMTSTVADGQAFAARSRISNLQERQRQQVAGEIRGDQAQTTNEVMGEHTRRNPTIFSLGRDLGPGKPPGPGLAFGIRDGRHPNAGHNGKPRPRGQRP